MNCHSAEKEVLALLMLLKVCFTSWRESHFMCTTVLYIWMGPQIKSTITNFVDLDDSLALVAPPIKGSPTTWFDPSLLYTQLPRDYGGFVVSFDYSALTETNGGYEWERVIAGSAYLEQTMLNMAEYRDMNNGVIAALDHSRLATQQSLKVIAWRKDLLMTLLIHHGEPVSKLKSVRYLHVIRKYNAAVEELNRIQEIFYESSPDDTMVENARSGNFVQILDGVTQRIHVRDGDILLQNTKKKRLPLRQLMHPPRTEQLESQRPVAAALNITQPLTIEMTYYQSSRRIADVVESKSCLEGRKSLQ
ncbi:hypothetical protein PHMEG_00018311 [Phytophthora megakarya]|uniref:Reverse transcriptase n=1 Tax=Phytophthora megakarya TaxID=4795 RepID=A0A225VV65_9STRA|nr:hypothetical protein PHMEG_00018311 [Phytophthora megakarya]